MKKNIPKKQKEIKISYKFAHIIIAIVTCLVLMAIVEWNREFLETEFLEGDIVLKSIYAPYDFTIKGDINSEATGAVKKQIVDAVLPVYVLDSAIKETVLNKINSFFASLQAIKEEVIEEERLSKIKELSALNSVSEAIINSLLDLKEGPKFFADTVSAVEHILTTGVISSSDISKLKESGVKNITLLPEKKGSEEIKLIEGLIINLDLRKKIEPFFSSLKDKKEKTMLIDIASSFLIPNIIYDQLETESRREKVSLSVEPIYNLVEVKKNELIINKGERISKAHLAKLNMIEQRESPALLMAAFFGIVIIMILFMMLLVLYIEFYEPELVVGNKELVLLAVICVLMVLAAKLIVVSPWPSTLIPVAVASMLIAILLNSRLAVITTCFLSILVGMMSGNRLDITVVAVVGGMIGIFAVRNVRRRSQLITAGFSVGLANMSYLIGMGLVNSLDFHTYMTESFLGFVNGIISAVIVTGILPIFENTFKVITDISLLELADLNHPILKEMVIKAPGTYHHSLVVGNLAEAACEAIRANSLLARVSAYFHDIGKIEKSEYFSENQPTVDSAHDKLSPTMSSLIITNHVKNGVELAQQYRLNRRIVDIIRQHHGTGMVFYFFKRALEKTADEEIGEEGFRYHGPKPQTREAACVLLADSVEASSRTLDDPTPASIKGLVRKIINNKFIDGQLDECDLTLKDLDKIAEVFTHILTGIYHTRVDYPEETGRKK